MTDERLEDDDLYVAPNDKANMQLLLGLAVTDSSASVFPEWTESDQCLELSGDDNVMVQTDAVPLLQRSHRLVFGFLSRLGKLYPVFAAPPKYVSPDQQPMDLKVVVVC